jgi:hypothetical protein
MKRFAVAVLMLCGVSVSVLTVSLMSARALPPPAAVQAFAWCGGYVCFRSITPGLTSWEEAKRVLSEQTSERHSRSFSILATTDGDAPISFYSHGEQVGFINANYWKGRTTLTLGDLVVALGSPCAVRLRVDERGRPVSIQDLQYPTLTVFISYVERMTPTSPITVVSIYKPAVAGEFCTLAVDGTTAAVAWAGFVALPQYAD